MFEIINSGKTETVMRNKKRLLLQIKKEFKKIR